MSFFDADRGHDARPEPGAGRVYATLTAFQRDLLHVVAEREGACGAELGRAVSEYRGRRAAASGRLYPNLDTLVDAGLVTKAERDGRENAYRVTAQGERALEERRAWEDES